MRRPEPGEIVAGVLVGSIAASSIVTGAVVAVATFWIGCRSVDTWRRHQEVKR